MAKTVLGLDIGNRFIKYVELAHGGGGHFSVVSAGMSPAPLKALQSDAPVDQEAIAIVIKRLLKDGGVRTKTVNIALPETSVFTRVIQVPPLSEKELAGAIRWEAEQYIPLPLEEVQMDFNMLGESIDEVGNKKLDVLLVAAPKNVITRYTKVINLVGLELESMETEILSVSRALAPQVANNQLVVVILNVGDQSTQLSILRKGLLTLTRSIPTGGAAFTNALAQDLGLPLPQAEEYKKTYGVLEDQLEGKVYRSLKPILSVIIEEIKRAITFFQTKYAGEVVSTVILSGGSAKLPGFVSVIANETGVEAQLGNPWLKVERDPKRFAKLDEEGTMFGVAVGLAMREA